MTTKGHHPSSDWLNYVKTSKAKGRIRNWIKKQEEEKSIAFPPPVFFIQLFDFLPGQPQKRFVLGHCFLNRILKISQQTEVQIFILIRQEPDFKRLRSDPRCSECL